MKLHTIKQCFIFLAGIAVGMHIYSMWDDSPDMYDMGTQMGYSSMHDMGTQTVPNLNDYVIIEYV